MKKYTLYLVDDDGCNLCTLISSDYLSDVITIPSRILACPSFNGDFNLKFSVVSDEFLGRSCNESL